MMQLTEGEKRRVFAIWLRSGRLPTVRSAEGLECKFNPWHDPTNGRFTYAGMGRTGPGFAGDGGSGRSNQAGGARNGPTASTMRGLPNTAHRPTNKDSKPVAHSNSSVAAKRPSERGTWTGGGFTGGGGGDFRGAGASGPGWETPEERRQRLALHIRHGRSPKPVVGPAGLPAGAMGASGERFQTVTRNGYTYEIDARSRTRRVSGALTLASTPVRSRTAQRQAGGVERRIGDDGGHYIAARFNGPTEAFNHFAQDAKFNRGDYRRLENEWAKEKRVGKAVRVKIVPQFANGSVRPDAINIWWTVDGNLRSAKFSNGQLETHHVSG